MKGGEEDWVFIFGWTVPLCFQSHTHLKDFMVALGVCSCYLSAIRADFKRRTSRSVMQACVCVCVCLLKLSVQWTNGFKGNVVLVWPLTFSLLNDQCRSVPISVNTVGHLSLPPLCFCWTLMCLLNSTFFNQVWYSISTSAAACVCVCVCVFEITSFHIQISCAKLTLQILCYCTWVNVSGIWSLLKYFFSVPSLTPGFIQSLENVKCSSVGLILQTS